MKKVFLTLCLIFVFSTAIYSQNEDVMIEGRAMWCYPSDTDTTLEAVDEFVKKSADAGFQILIPVIKGTRGVIYWHSKKFPEVIEKKWKNFDFLKHFTEAAHRYGLQVHAWLCDFTEGENSPAYQKHPEWAQRNPDGGITSSEVIQNGRRYNIVWMCPAQRPGYTDQWLLPMIQEIVENYDVDGIHHDYVRYPGDVAPNDYCYCDYCLENIPKYNHLYFEDMPDKVFEIDDELPKKSANWWYEPTVRPENWENMTRKEKVNFLKTGSFMKDGVHDLTYFHWEYRSDQITRFVKEAWEISNEVNPDIEMSAAVFKYPTHSGRFIGQRWNDFAPWVDIMMPMCYRSHYPGTFEDYLKMLAETVRYENMWASNKTLMYIGFAIHYLYNDEHEIINNINALCGEYKNENISKTAFKRGFNKNLAKIKELVTDTSLLEKFDKSLGIFTETGEVDSVLSVTNEIVSQRYHSLYPPGRVSETIEAIREAGGRGIVVFAGGAIEQYNLWDTIKESFSTEAKPPYPEGLQRSVSSVGLKTFQKEVDRLTSRIRKVTGLSYTYGTIALILFLFLAVILLRKMKK